MTKLNYKKSYLFRSINWAISFFYQYKHKTNLQMFLKINYEFMNSYNKFK